MSVNVIEFEEMTISVIVCKSKIITSIDSVIYDGFKLNAFDVYWAHRSLEESEA